MGLTEYQRKRRFDRTSEPRGSAASARRASKSSEAVFVVQKHDASRLHYDFRLEMDGVLKSWAVPKGPSLDPDDKSLAIQVEDHPIEYGSFEGVIPEGQYGGGTVMLWDRGTWNPLDEDPSRAYSAGKLKFRLSGKKLRGDWLLVRIGGRAGKPQWLLRKLPDEHARPKTEYDVREREPSSVSSRRSLEQIAQHADAVWNSNGHRTPPSNGKSRARRTGSAPGAAPTPKKAARPKPVDIEISSIAGAQRSPMPRTIEPQLATLVSRAPAGDGWVHEMKFDGYRALARVDGGAVRLLTRRANDWTRRFGPIAGHIAALGLASAILDGEVVALSGGGKPSFQSLQRAMKFESAQKTLAYFVFDILYLNGWDLRGCTLDARRSVLQGILARAGSKRAAPSVHFSEAIRGRGADVFANACRLGMEGVVSKRADAVYESGRSRTWLKSKCTNRQEFVIAGYSEPQGSRAGFGSLVLGYYRDGGLVYAGKVGTGFDDRLLADLRKKLNALEVPDSPFITTPGIARGGRVHWVRPRLVGEVEFTEWTADGILRHPSFQGLREDKDAREVVMESPKAAEVGGAGPNPDLNGSAAPTKRAAPAKGRQAAKRPSSAGGQANVLGIPLSNPDRVLYPEQGLTKRGLAEYYEAVAAVMMPYVLGRPLTLVRCPRGRGAACFYQKHMDEQPPGLHGVKIKEAKGSGIYMVLDAPAGLISLVQRGVLEIHTWGCTEKDLERPDRLIFDLDPGPGIVWRALVEAAHDIKDRLKKDGLESFVKLTGGKGLHVVAPIRRGPDWDSLKSYAHSLALTLAAEHPDRYVSIMTKSKRRGRIFVDYLRNGRGATAVAPYSTRAREGATVSVPITWAELDAARSLPAWSVQDTLARLRTQRRDPWTGFFDARQGLRRRA